MKYFDEMCRAMEFLARDPATDGFSRPGRRLSRHGMTNTLKNVSRDKLLELPVTEEMQMGMSTGLALGGHVPVSIYPRWNFLLLAVNQIVNHLDKLPIVSNGGYQPKVIIRTGIGSERPLHPQHFSTSAISRKRSA
jgi:pyruvate/2-oxoglutarate/acetoin dehydrogenase E1 component